MLLVILVLSYASLLTWLYGVLTIAVFHRILTQSVDRSVPVPLIHMVGLISISVLVNCLTFVARVGPAAHLLIGGGGSGWYAVVPA